MWVVPGILLPEGCDRPSAFNTVDTVVGDKASELTVFTMEIHILSGDLRVTSRPRLFSTDLQSDDMQLFSWLRLTILGQLLTDFLKGYIPRYIRIAF